MSTRQGTAISMQAFTNAAIQSWSNEVQQTFLLGWTQTSDTGQTASSSLVAPGTANTVAGYQLYHMADSLQGAAPVFAKIEYGTNGASPLSMSMWLTIGTGSDGAGNITGTLLPRTQTSVTGTGATSATTYGSAASNRFAWVGGTSSLRAYLSIERSKDGAGNDTTDGLLVVVEGNTLAAASVKVHQYLKFSSNLMPNATAFGLFAPSGTTWADGASVGVCPDRFNNGTPSNPGLNHLAYLNADTPAGVAVSVPLYGASHTYMPIGSAVMSTVAALNANSSLMMRWE